MGAGAQGERNTWLMVGGEVGLIAASENGTVLHWPESDLRATAEAAGFQVLNRREAHREAYRIRNDAAKASVVAHATMVSCCTLQACARHAWPVHCHRQVGSPSAGQLQCELRSEQPLPLCLPVHELAVGRSEAVGQARTDKAVVCKTGGSAQGGFGGSQATARTSNTTGSFAAGSIGSAGSATSSHTGSGAAGSGATPTPVTGTSTSLSREGSNAAASQGMHPLPHSVHSMHLRTRASHCRRTY